MKRFFFLYFIAIFAFFGCCPDSVYPLDISICADQVFVESKVVPIDFVYTVNSDKKFLEAKTLQSADIQKALRVEGSNFTVTAMELTSASIAYKKEADNNSAAVFVNLAVVDKTNELIALMAKNELLPLIDIPGTFFTPEVNINKLLNEKGVKELSKVAKEYFSLLNDQGIAFILVGEPSPPGTKAHFSLHVKMSLSIQYEVCRHVPLGTGLRLCE